MDSDSESDSEDSSSDSESEDEMEEGSKVSDSRIPDSRISDSRISDSGSTLPFDANHNTLRQTSRPFTYEPDDLSPVSGASKGNFVIGDLSEKSVVNKNDHTHHVRAGKKRHHSEKSSDEKRLRLSDVGRLTEGKGKLRPMGVVNQLLVQIPLSKVPEMQQKSKPQVRTWNVMCICIQCNASLYNGYHWYMY